MSIEKKYPHTRIPNIVFDILELGLISNSSFILYSVYKRIAGDTGVCWVGTRELATKCRMSKNNFASLKKELSKSFEILNGKSLIKISKASKRLQEGDNVVIVDIWEEDYIFCQNKYMCPKIENNNDSKNISFVHKCPKIENNNLSKKDYVSQNEEQTCPKIENKGVPKWRTKEEQEEKQLRKTTTTPVVVVFSDEKKEDTKQATPISESAESLKKWLDQEAFKKRFVGIYDYQLGPNWIIDIEIYLELIQKYDVQYFQKQLWYTFQRGIDHFEKGKTKVDNPIIYLELACKNNYAKFKRK